MPLYRASLRALGALLLLATALACGGKKGTDAAASTTAVVSGTITYSRVPLAKDANGVPTGLADSTVAANLTSLPMRGIVVRAYQQLEQTQPDGTTTRIWKVVSNTTSDSTGAYSLTVKKDNPTLVEVLSSFAGGNSLVINVLAEPGGIASNTPALDRLRYALRKAPDGSAPSGVPTPSSVVTGDTTLNFTVGLHDAWWVVNPAFTLATSVAPLLDQAVLETDLPGRTPGDGSGSRITGIGDTIASFVANYGTATPGTVLDLHYWPGRSEAKGSYIDFNTSDYPQAYDSSTNRYHMFGSIQGGPANDDAWDEGVILPMLARNVLYASNASRTFFIPMNPLFPVGAPMSDLKPDMARIEGLAGAMAANVLKSPYLADTQGTTLAHPVVDIRDLSGVAPGTLGPTSAPALQALGWEVILKSNSLASPGSSTTWDTINPLAARRFFLAPTSLTKAATDTTGARDVEPINVYSQMGRLSEGRDISIEPIDLSAIFTDPVITSLAAPFGIVWPRPTVGALSSFVGDWGTDPTTTIPPVSLSMAKAVQVNGLYPNVSEGEVFYSGFNVSVDRRLRLQVAIAPALDPGVRLDVDLPGASRSFSFTGSGSTSTTFLLGANSTPPYYHPVRLRLVSPTALQPDVTVTLAFVPAP